MKCITQEEGNKILLDIDGGTCGNYASSRTLVGKIFHQRFYWSTALQDAFEPVKKCVSCQLFGKQTTRLPQALQTIPLSWPFSIWGLDIL